MPLQAVRKWLLGLALGAVLVLGVLLAVGWYYSSVLHDSLLVPDYSPPTLNLEVVAVEDGRIVLRERPGENVDALDDGLTWGLDAEAGYGQVSEVLGIAGAEVTRAFGLVEGSIEAGDLARLDSFAYEGDPMAARGLAFRDVVIAGEPGAMPAWQLDGEQDTWVIFIHGWRSDREEALRVLPKVQELGVTSLVITYRNDEEAPPSDDGLIRWGATEWRDLEAAVLYARSHGAERIVLYGYSMGGGIVMRFLQQSQHAGLVAGVVLDAPVLDFDALVSFHAGRQNIPGLIVTVGMQFSDRRFDLDRDAMDHLAGVDRLQVPILLFHGGNDERAPIATSRRLAELRPDLVEFHVVDNAGHVQSWNAGPAAYEALVQTFLARVASLEAP